MGKVSEYILELGEKFEEIRQTRGTWQESIDAMEQILPPDEFQFFTDHIDIIQDNLGYNTGMNEASGIKGDVLRPYGGRKARSKMGYGRGNRAGFNPEDEIDSEDEIFRQEALMQDVEDNYMPPLTSEIIDDEEVFDVGGSEDDWIYDTPKTHGNRMSARKEMLAKPAPVGTGGVDNVFDDDGIRIEEDLDDEGREPGVRYLEDYEDEYETPNPEDYEPVEDGEAMVPDEEIMMEPLDTDVEVVTDEDDEFTLKVGGETDVQEPMHYDLDADRDMGEDPYGEGDDMYMPTMESYINEDWTVIQDFALISLIPLLGALAINYVKSKDEGIKGEELKAGWQDWISDMRRKISPSYDRKMQRQEEKAAEMATRANVRDAVEKFGKGELTMDEVEKIVTQDKKVAEAVKMMMKNPREGYQRLYTALKNAINVQGVRGTPIPDIKDRFVQKQTAFHADRVKLENEAKDALQAFADKKGDINAVRNALSKLPEGQAYDKLLDEFISGADYNRDRFYSLLKKLYNVGLASETPGPKMIRRFKKEAAEGIARGEGPGDYANESVLAKLVKEYYDEDDEMEDRYRESEERSSRSFRDRERNAGVEDEDPDQQRQMVRSLQGKYYKLQGGGYIPALYHTPDMGPVDGKTYMKNKKTGGYFPVR